MIAIGLAADCMLITTWLWLVIGTQYSSSCAWLWFVGAVVCSRWLVAAVDCIFTIYI